jgi:hypothetical protein
LLLLYMHGLLVWRRLLHLLVLLVLLCWPHVMQPLLLLSLPHLSIANLSIGKRCRRAACWADGAAATIHVLLLLLLHAVLLPLLRPVVLLLLLLGRHPLLRLLLPRHTTMHWSCLWPLLPRSFMLLLLLLLLLLWMPAACPAQLLLVHIPAAVLLLVVLLLHGCCHAWHDWQWSCNAGCCFHSWAGCVQAAPGLLILHQHWQLSSIKSFHRHLFDAILTRHANAHHPCSCTTSSSCGCSCSR